MQPKGCVPLQLGRGTRLAVCMRTVVVAIDPVHDVQPGLSPSVVAYLVDPLDLQCFERTLHGCVVPGIAFPAHRLVDVNLYGYLPAIKSNLHCFVIKSAANLYSALRVEFFSFPDCSTGPDAYPLANTSSIFRAIDALVDTQV